MINIEAFLQVLPLALKGWLGVFIVIAVVMVLILALNAITSRSKKDGKDAEN